MALVSLKCDANCTLAADRRGCSLDCGDDSDRESAPASGSGISDGMRGSSDACCAPNRSSSSSSSSSSSPSSSSLSSSLL